MTLAFISLRIFDLIDIILVAFLLYQVYMLVRGTVAIKIFIGIFIVYLIWLIVKALNMQLLSTILGQFMGVGMIALIIVFQQEIRKFLLVIGSRYKFDKHFSFDKFLSGEINTKTNIDEIVIACKQMSSKKIGALIVLTKKSDLINITSAGDSIEAEISSILINSIFFKNSPLHDGAIVISGNKIKSARCILPLSDNKDLPSKYGLRHRAAIGLTQVTDAVVIVVSEETGDIAFVIEGNIQSELTANKLKELLKKEF